MKLLGLDVSTKTGIAFLNSDGTPHHGKIWTGSSVYLCQQKERFARLKELYFFIRNLVRVDEPDLTVLEGYAFTGPFVNQVLVELAVTTRLALVHAGVHFVEIPPTTLKAFVSKGSAKKDLMRLAVFKEWGFEHEYDDAVDAFALAQVGRGIVGDLQLTAHRYKLLSGVKSVKESSLWNPLKLAS